MEKLYKLVEGYFKRYPEGVDPFQMATRLLEECGEVAREVNHFEDSGVKRIKYGEPSKSGMAMEIMQALQALMQIAVYYHVEEELERGIDRSLGKMKAEKLIDDSV
jgi:NTP pyrophosphatase (non-canonical NTP hydrolase)